MLGAARDGRISGPDSRRKRVDLSKWRAALADKDVMKYPLSDAAQTPVVNAAWTRLCTRASQRGAAG